MSPFANLAKIRFSGYLERMFLCFILGKQVQDLAKQAWRFPPALSCGWIDSRLDHLPLDPPYTCSCRSGRKHKDKRPCDFHQTCKGGAGSLDKSLDSISRIDKAVVSGWRSVCARISSNVPPFHLRLFLICDTANYQVATEVVEPLGKCQLSGPVQFALVRSPIMSFAA